jgi:uncharacterized RDD family membrane protein YckC
VSEYTAYPRDAAAREAEQAAPGSDIAYSGWWRRAAALLIDTILIWVVVVALFALAFGIAEVSGNAGAILLIVAIVAAIAGPIWYTIWATGREPGQTVGKKALGIRVRHAEQDRAIGYGPSTGRYLITIAFGFFVIPALVDYLWPLWDGRKQALHDKVANSIVVRA